MSEIQFVPTEPAVDAWRRLQEMTARAEAAEAKLAAVPVDDITYLWRFAPRNAASQRTCMRVGDWLQSFRK